jgi:microsomal dipeptidase-like Zn-dependent dipeptidase
MATDLQSPTEQQNMASLVTGIMNDAQDLFKQQVNLVRQEIKEDFRKTKEASIPMAIGLWLAGTGIFLLCVTAALGLAAAGLSYWASFAIVGTVVTLAGAGLTFAGKKKFESFNPLPDQSAEALKENLEWIAKPK